MSRYHWQCSVCGVVYAPAAVRYVCPGCGNAGLLDMVPDYERIRRNWGPTQLSTDRRLSIWRYLPLLPLGEGDCDAPIDSWAALASVGWTPLLRAPRLGKALGLTNLFVKDDGRNPTGSFKDRASALVVAKAIESGESTVATASSGNAGAALAGMGAAAGVSSVIFVPESAPQAKVAQLLIYGATVLLVRGSYDEAFDLCRAACEEWGWYCRNTGYNPHTTEGKKTCAFEIIEQLAWSTPDTVLVAVGDGNIISGLFRGFRDAIGLGWTRRLPRLIGVQAARSPAVYHAWCSGAADVSPDRAETLADSINVSQPRDGRRALRAIRESGGLCLVVEEEAIVDAMGTVARQTGVFVEPASAAAFAGLFALATRGEVGSDERVVVVNTGNGLKDVRSAVSAPGRSYLVEPDLRAVRNALAGEAHFTDHARRAR